MLMNNNNNTYIYIAQYPANTACSTRLYIYNIMYKTIIHDDIVYSIKRLFYIINLKQSIVLAFVIRHGSTFQRTDAVTVK